jgi:hypothetical protein
MADYKVTAYSSNRNYHLKRGDYSKIIRDEPDLPPAKDRAESLARELLERSHRQRLGWVRLTITPVAEEPTP